MKCQYCSKSFESDRHKLCSDNCKRLNHNRIKRAWYHKNKNRPKKVKSETIPMALSKPNKPTILIKPISTSDIELQKLFMKGKL